MTSERIEKYLKNCFILIIPVLFWNMLFHDKLPALYQPTHWNNVPMVLNFSENVLRIFVFGIPVVMHLSLKKKIQQVGFVLYLFGIFIYFFSWVAHVTFPDESWSNSLTGFMAPAFTPLIWLLGIGLIGQESTVSKIPRLSTLYLIFVLLFTAVHSLHAYLVYVN